MNSHPPLVHPSYRPDIDGLRAIAVLSVIGFHAFPALLPGGFIGVDIFFVISGYLISTILYGSLEQDRFSIAQFYQRRIKRIFPALALVLGAAFAFGWFALLADEYKQLGKQMAGGAGFIANFLLWKESGYFDSAAEMKPLLHLWSLGIEEQFYIGWPLILWLAYKRKINLLGVAAVLGAASFVLNLAQVKADPVATFYSPQTRVWELLAGALVAQFGRGGAAGLLARLQAQARTRDALSLIGAGLIVAGLVWTSKDKAFPGWLALLPVGGACLLVAAGARALANRLVLAHPALVWVGLISYPLYLWHWPLLAYARIMSNGGANSAVRAALMVLAVLLAWLTYRFIERPVRTRGTGWKTPVALAALMLGIGATGLACYQSGGLIFGRKFNLVMSEDDIKQERQKYWNGDRSHNYEADLPKVIVFGDSQAFDVFKALSNEPAIGLQYMQSSHQCSAFSSRTAGEPDYTVEVCRRDFEHLLNSPQLLTADTLIYAHLWQEGREAVENYQAGLALLRQKNPRLKVLIFGHKPLIGANWGASINAITRDHPSLIGMNKYLNKIKNLSDESYIKKIAADNQVEFVDVQAIFCDDGCPMFVDNDFSYFDFDHWTEAGARLFQQRLAKWPVYGTITSRR